MTVSGGKGLPRPSNVTHRLPATAQRGLGMSAGAGPQASNLAAMGSNYTLFTVVDSIAESVASAEWKLFRKRVDQRRRLGAVEPERTEILVHPALSLWNRPNPFMTQSEFSEISQQHFELVGEYWWVVVRYANIPSELWPIRPDRMVVVPHKTDFIAGYVYLSPDGERIPLNVEDVIRVRRPNPIDPYRGIGGVQTIMADIQGVALTAEWNRNFFLNSARPDGIITFPGRMGDAEWKEFQARWAEGHRGVSNAHRVATLEGGAGWTETSMSHKDMQFTELLGVTEEKIRKVYRYPKPLLGSVDDVNRANADAAQYAFARTLINPKLNRMRGALGELLLMYQASTTNMVFDYCYEVPEDMEAQNAALTAKTSALQTLVNAGFDRDEACDTVGLPRMAAGTKLEKEVIPDGTSDVVESSANGKGRIDAQRLVPYRG